MSKFLEKHHAYISAYFYLVLKEMDLINYRNIFKLATRKTAEERGRRMALRALRDGRTLTYETYRQYGEWGFSNEYIKSLNGKKNIELLDSNEDYAYIVYHCPWADAYRELGLSLDGGIDYCSDLDAAIIRGFNPNLDFKITQTLNETDKCIQCQIGGLSDRASKLVNSRNHTTGFEYQCGHIFKSFSDVMISTYPGYGQVINERVARMFESKFGTDMLNKVLAYKDTNFNIV